MRLILLNVLFLSCCVACSPVVRVEVPDKPITINLNVKIEHEIKVKVDKELDELFSKDEAIF